jgi:hypothetical protein
MAGPLTGVIPAARALSRQRGGPSIPSWGLATTVWGTQLHGWSSHWCDSHCLPRHSSAVVPAALEDAHLTDEEGRMAAGFKDATTFALMITVYHVC